MFTCLTLGTPADKYGASHHAALRALEQGDQLQDPAAQIKFLARADDIFQKITHGPKSLGVVLLGDCGSGPPTASLRPWLSGQAVPFHIVGEIEESLNYCLVTKREVHGPDDLRVILSDPESRQECSSRLQEYCEQYQIGCQSAESMSDAIDTVLRSQKTNLGAIATEFAANEHQLAVLQENLQDGQPCRLRYGVLGKQRPKATGHDKTAFLFRAKQLIEALGRFYRCADGYAEICRLDTIPLKTDSHAIYVETSGHIQVDQTRRFHERLRREFGTVSVLGSFPRASVN